MIFVNLVYYIVTLQLFEITFAHNYFFSLLCTAQQKAIHVLRFDKQWLTTIFFSYWVHSNDKLCPFINRALHKQIRGSLPECSALGRTSNIHAIGGKQATKQGLDPGLSVNTWEISLHTRVLRQQKGHSPLLSVRRQMDLIWCFHKLSFWITQCWGGTFVPEFYGTGSDFLQHLPFRKWHHPVLHVIVQPRRQIPKKGLTSSTQQKPDPPQPHLSGVYVIW